jgi:hypothetical protein
LVIDSDDGLAIPESVTEGIGVGTSSSKLISSSSGPRKIAMHR